jgi:hypothetical protein
MSDLSGRCGRSCTSSGSASFRRTRSTSEGRRLDFVVNRARESSTLNRIHDATSISRPGAGPFDPGDRVISGAKPDLEASARQRARTIPPGGSLCRREASTRADEGYEARTYAPRKTRTGACPGHADLWSDAAAKVRNGPLSPDGRGPSNLSTWNDGRARLTRARGRFPRRSKRRSRRPARGLEREQSP